MRVSVSIVNHTDKTNVRYAALPSEGKSWLTEVTVNPSIANRPCARGRDGAALTR